MVSKFLDQYSVILLDMNSTFMFGEDCFGESEDFYQTYVAQGGERLGRDEVQAAIRRCYDGMAKDYADPAKFDDFPSLAEGLQQYADVDSVDLTHLEALFARHECGQVPPEFSACLQRLSLSHKLGVVSNIWAKKEAWLAEFRRVGIDDIWDVTIFSSESRSIKPSPALFKQAIAAFDVPQSRMLFVGDSLRADIVPAKALGLDTVWICPEGGAHPMADCVVSSILQLESLPLER